MPPRGESWDVAAEVNGKQVEFGLTPGAPHRLQNALAALASIHAAGLDAGGAGERTRPCRHHDRPRRRADGRRRHRDRRQFQRQSGQHGGRARQPEGAAGAKPAGASPFSATCWNWAPMRRPITPSSPAICPGIDGVYCVGPLMRHLYDLVAGGAGARLARRPGHARSPGSRRIAAGRRRRGGQGQQKDVLGEQVCAEAAGRLAGKGVNWPQLATRCFRMAIRQYPIRDQDLLGLRMKMIIKALPEPLRSASRKDGATKPRDRAY